MEITEKDLEDLIFDDLKEGGNRLMRTGFYTPLISTNTQNKVYWHRQVYLGDYGVADIIGLGRCNGHIKVDVIELKKVPLRSNDFDQLLRYCYAVKTVASNSLRKGTHIVLNPVLVGPSIEDGHYLHNNLDMSVYTYKFTINGFEFEHHTGSWCRPKSEKLTIHGCRSSDMFILPG